MPPKNNHERRRSRSKSNNKSGNISSSTSTPTMTKNEDSTFEEAIKGMDSMVRKELIRKVGKDLWKKLSWKQRHQFAFPTERIIIKKPSTMITTKKNKKEIIDQKKINQKKYMNVAAVDADAADSVVVVDVKTTSLISDPAKDMKIVAKKSALMSTTPATNTSAHTTAAANQTNDAWSQGAHVPSPSALVPLLQSAQEIDSGSRPSAHTPGKPPEHRRASP